MASDKLSLSEAARILAAPRATIERHVRRGALRTYADSHGVPHLSRREVESLRERAFASLAKQQRRI